jgi:hypothetical protein
VIIFGSVRFLSKKIIKLNFFKKNRNWFKPTGFGSVWFFRTKTGSNRFVSVFSVLARFFWFFLVFWFGFSSVRFFRFQTYKTKTEPVGFFKILIGLIEFFSRFDFLVIFFWFSRFNRFFNFFAHF